LEVAAMIGESDFENTVRGALEVPLASYGYRHVESDGYRVRFDSPSHFVEVFYDAARSHEVAITIDALQRWSDSPPMQLSDVLRATNCSEVDVRFAESIQVSDEAALERLLVRIAKLLRENASGFLEGQPALYSAAEHIRSEQAEQYTLEVVRRPILEESDLAWASKDYGRVRDLLNPIKDSLSETYRRRLALAVKHLP
jgi:hypothetical protein